MSVHLGWKGLAEFRDVIYRVFFSQLFIKISNRIVELVKRTCVVLRIGN